MENGETVCCIVAGRLNPKQNPARKADAPKTPNEQKIRPQERTRI